MQIVRLTQKRRVTYSGIAVCDRISRKISAIANAPSVDASAILTQVYKKHFVTERTFAWIDKFKRLLIQFERKKVYFLGFHLLAYTLINLRDVLQKSKRVFKNCGP
jgi:transposase